MLIVIVVVECYWKEKVTEPNNYIFFSFSRRLGSLSQWVHAVFRGSL